MSKELPFITEHAILRYFERELNLASNVAVDRIQEALQDNKEKLKDNCIIHMPSGSRIIIKNYRVVTILPKIKRA